MPLPGRRSSFIRGVGGRATKRQTLWLFQDAANVTMTGAGGNLLTSLSAAALALRPFTVVRTLMTGHVTSDQAGAHEDQAGAWGAAIVSAQAVGIGVTAVPTPVTDQGSDLWFAYKYFAGAGDQSTGGGVSGFGFEIDSRAMRKVEDGQDLITVAEMDAGVSQGIQLIISGRMLIKTH